MDNQTDLWIERRFEDLYRQYDDPWGCTAQAGSLNNEILLAMLKTYREQWAWALDIGCGQGALTERIAKATGAMAVGIDVSGTAIMKAEEMQRENCIFMKCDVMTDTISDIGIFDVVVMAEVLWYICDNLDMVLGKITDILRPGGVLAIHQYFPNNQKHYRDIIDGLEGFERAMSDKWEYIRKVVSYFGTEGQVLLALFTPKEERKCQTV